MKKRYLILQSVLIVLICLNKGVSAQQTPKSFLLETQYLLSLPDGYASDTTKKWPLLIFLHGSGERGTDIEKVKTHGPPKLIAKGKKFPFIVVSPQAVLPYSWEPENLFHLLNFIKENYQVDREKIYLTGLSMGGFGTWAFALKYPNEFAAIVPICGGGDTTELWKLRHMPIHCFHGALDHSVPVVRSEEMVAAVRKYNNNVQFTVYPDLDHNSWERTYNNDSLYDWLLNQSKFRYTEIPMDSMKLKSFSGKFASSERDTITIQFANNELKATIGKRPYSLKPSTEDQLYIREDLPLDMQFSRSKKGKIISFMLYGSRRLFYRKLQDKN
ncbi:MAG: prolyl oligopeptidase family serine peptidase [Ferruginibacter sp.]